MTLALGTRALPAILILPALCLTHPEGARADHVAWTFPLRISVARAEGELVRDQSWVDDQVAVTNRVFASTGVSFVVAERRELSGSAEVALPGEFDRLNAMHTPEVIDVFVFARVRGRVTWAGFCGGLSRRGLARGYVTLTQAADHDTLAHELGHEFGLGHRAGTVMGPTAPIPEILDATQRSLVIAAARRFEAEGAPRLVAVH